MYEAMTIVVGKDMAIKKIPNHMLISTWKRTLKCNRFQLKMKGNMNKFQKQKRHLPLVHKRDNIEREIACMKMMVLKNCLKRLEM
jgi:hypothetical protein